MRGCRGGRRVAESRERPDGTNDEDGPDFLQVTMQSNEYIAVKRLIRNRIKVLDEGINLGEQRVISA